ncbi:MAG: transglycosylase SLT domain-containing protein [Methylococcales bacterium]
MRLLLFVLNILIGVSLSTAAPELAAATSVKAGKSKSQKLYRAHLNKKASNNPGDVWERIRLGMRIPRAIAVQTQTPSPGKNNLAQAEDLSSNLATASTEQSSTSVTMKMRAAPENSQASADANLTVRPYTLIPPTPNYTELGKLRLGKKAPSTTIINCTSPTPAQVRQEYARRNKAKIALLNEQISSSMDFHPELRRRTVILGPGSHLNNTLSTSSSTLAERAKIGNLTKLNLPATTPCNTAKVANLRHQELAADPQQKSALSGENNSKQAIINERINKQIAAYTQNPGFLYRVAERAHPYLFHIVEGLSKNQLPMELALLPIVESAYQPTAQSPKSAAGLWQFIPSTGKDFNLEQNSEYDERLDIPESTQAAIRFLSGLKNHFKGDWLLALAAYNSGQGTVDNAISRNQAEGLATDFWSLRLPEETQNYVPRLLALSNIFSHPSSYGIKLPPVRNEPYFVKVKIDSAFDINYLAKKDIGTVAKLANLSYEQFARLNPGFLNNTLSRNGPYTFLMPVENANQLHERLASIAQFVAEPAAPVKSVVLKEKPQANINLPNSPLSLVSELVKQKAGDEAKFSTPFLSLNIGDA